MKKIILSLIILFMVSTVSTPNIGEAARGPKYTEKMVHLKTEMKRLWIENAWWTREYIVSNLAGIEDQQPVLNRLLKNQDDIGNLIKPYYGEKAGNKFTELLKEHISIAGNIIEAAKKGDQANVVNFNKEWTRNADQIVSFLAKANPNWSKTELTEMFYRHLQLTANEVEARLKKDWKTDIQTADLNEAHLIHMANFLTEGIVKQFPKKFK